MQHLSPLGPVYQAGTYREPFSNGCWSKNLDLLDEVAYDYLEQLGAIMEEKVHSVLEKHNFPMRLVRMESLFWFSPGNAEPAIRAIRYQKMLNVVRRCSPRVAQPWLHARSVCLRNWFPIDIAQRITYPWFCRSFGRFTQTFGLVIMNGKERIVSALNLEPVDRTPVWFMRQAGRHLPEYRNLASKHSFWDRCMNIDICTTITMQPIHRYKSIDAALFQ